MGSHGSKGRVLVVAEEELRWEGSKADKMEDLLAEWGDEADNREFFKGRNEDLEKNGKRRV